MRSVSALMAALAILTLLLAAVASSSATKATKSAQSGKAAKSMKPTAKSTKKTSSSSSSGAENSLWKDIHLRSVPEQAFSNNSYLLDDSTNDIFRRVVKDLLYIIKAKQQLPREQCSQRRLLVMQISSTSFEGIGSLLKQTQFSVAIAMHSNRSVVWGYGFPFMFEHSKDVWDGPDNDQILINGNLLNCQQEDPLAGPMGCFFEPLTTCSLGDVPPGDLVAFSQNAWNDSARLAVSEVRKGVALYHPPAGLMDYIYEQRQFSPDERQAIQARESLLWAAAVSAYVFRLKQHLVDSFRAKFQGLLNDPLATEIWGLHVRHGDVKALSNVYGYKEVFDFEDFFAAAISLSHTLRKTPDKLFVATDSLQADRVPTLYARFMNESLRKARVKSAPIQSQQPRVRPNKRTVEQSIIKVIHADGSREASRHPRDDDEEDDDYEEDYGDDEDEEDYDEDDEEDYLDDEEEDDFPSFIKPRTASEHTWYQYAQPGIFSISNQDRYRTEHGSHTVAANGGCQRDEQYQERGMRCALNFQAIVHYQTLTEHRSVSRAMRIMRVLYESIEDLYFLSQCTSLVAQGSSHFSTLAALLIWARTGAPHLDRNTLFLDQPKIIQGFIPTAFLHGMNLLNGTQSLDESAASHGQQRWAVHTTYFLSGLERHVSNKVRVPFNPWSVENRMKLVLSVPSLPLAIFYHETKSWLGYEYTTYKPVWPGMCPGVYGNAHTANWTPLEYITTTINLGVDHLSSSHEGQALQCWQDAVQAIDLYPHVDHPDRMKDYRSIAVDNAATLKRIKYAEMVINENRNTRDFLDYQQRYMARSALDEIRAGRKSDLKSLDEVNEEIIALEGQLGKLKALRDRLISANYVLLSGGIDSSQLENRRGTH